MVRGVGSCVANRGTIAAPIPWPEVTEGRARFQPQAGSGERVCRPVQDARDRVLPPRPVHSPVAQEVRRITARGGESGGHGLPFLGLGDSARPVESAGHQGLLSGIRQPGAPESVTLHWDAAGREYVGRCLSSQRRRECGPRLVDMGDD